MGEIPIVPSGSWFQSAMVLFTKETSDVCSYHPCSYFPEMIDPTKVVWRLQPVPYIIPRPFNFIRFVESAFNSILLASNMAARLFLYWKKYSHTYYRNITKSMPPIRQNQWTYIILVRDQHATRKPSLLHITSTPKWVDLYHSCTRPPCHPYAKTDGQISTCMPPICQIRWTNSQSQSYITTDGQSVCVSWCRAPSGARDQIFIYCLTLTVLSMRGCPLWREGGSVLYLSQSTVGVYCQ
jgi:hypothetical protein